MQDELMKNFLLSTEADLRDDGRGGSADWILEVIEHIEDLEAQLKKDLTPPSAEGCARSGHNDGKHQWMSTSSLWVCSWCGEHRPHKS